VSLSSRIEGIKFASADYLASLGGLKQSQMLRKEYLPEFDYARAKISVACAVVGIECIDASAQISGKSNVFKESNKAARMGFTGKGAIKLSQLEAILRGFLPSIEEVEFAKEIMELSKETKGKGVRGVIDGDPVLPPMVAQAENTLERYEKWGAREEYES
jgi:citrate lyase subunit beta/citryl-CoA lyase